MNLKILIKGQNIILSQSIVKELGIYVIDEQLHDVDFCPYRVYRKYISEDYPDVESEPMLYGKYGETHLLGGSAKGTSQWTLPHKKHGGLKEKHKRIDIQIQRLYGYMKAFGISWNENNVQVPLIAKYKDYVWIKGEMDIFPAMVDGKLSIIDTKFTKTVHSIFSSIKEEYIRHSTMSCWGNFDDIYKNQALMYLWLARNFKSTGLENLIKFSPQSEAKYNNLFEQHVDYNNTTFFFFVAGYDVPDISDEIRRFEYEWTDRRRGLFEYMIENALIRIQDCIDAEWKPNPKEHLCNSCALKDQCLK